MRDTPSSPRRRPTATTCNLRRALFSGAQAPVLPCSSTCRSDWLLSHWAPYCPRRGSDAWDNPARSSRGHWVYSMMPCCGADQISCATVRSTRQPDCATRADIARLPAIGCAMTRQVNLSAAIYRARLYAQTSITSGREALPLGLAISDNRRSGRFFGLASYAEARHSVHHSSPDQCARFRRCRRRPRAALQASSRGMTIGGGTCGGSSRQAASGRGQRRKLTAPPGPVEERQN